MAVGDVEPVEVAERVEVRRRILDLPSGVGHAVGSLEVEDRARRGVGEHPGGDRRAVDRAIAEAEEDRFGVAGCREQVPRAVVLLVGTGLLVLADLAGPILRDLDAADQARAATCRRITWR